MMIEVLHLAAMLPQPWQFRKFRCFYRDPIGVMETAAKSKSRRIRDTAF